MGCVQDLIKSELRFATERVSRDPNMAKTTS